jgi:S-DNA-T family DNA segregation ATPase FtsK/SpoIIIE
MVSDKSRPVTPRKGKGKRKPENPDRLRPDLKPQMSLGQFIRDERTHKVMGVLLLLVALYLFLAFTSYLFTWQQDQAKVFDLSYRVLFTKDVQIDNLLGRLGAFVSHLFFYKGLGLSSYFFCYLFFILGTNEITGKKIFNIWRNIRYVLFGILFLSTFLAFVLRRAGFPAGGAMGNMISDYLQGFLGRLGTTLLLVVAGLAFLIWKFNFNFRVPRRSIPVTVPPAPIPDAGVAKGAPVLPQENKGESGLKYLRDPETDLSHLEFKLVEKTAANLRDLPEMNGAVTPKNGNGLIAQIPFEIRSQEDDKPDPKESADSLTKEEVMLQDPYEPTLDLKSYKYPPLDLLENHGSERIVQDNEELEKNKIQIINTLRNYDIAIQKISATVGPTVTLYEIVPAAGVRISRIKNLEDDIALSLAALGIRIIAPIPGKGTIGIEVPNVRKTVVSMRTLLASERFQQSKMNLPVAIGKRIDNENFIVDLTTMPHLMMAGATGQGKSVGINAILVSLLYKKHPSQLKLVLVDPKKVELSLYKTIEKHFLAKLPGEEDAIITDTKKVIYTLNALCIEMDIRYDLLKEAGTRNIREYNEKFIHRRLNPEKGHRYLPFIVLVIDEFADLIMTAGKEIEMPLARLAQLARAVGIHLIIATQRPSVNIITGTIKANFPARIAFKVSSKVDSRTIIDTGGAEQLIGKGDMLIAYNGELVRLQCAFVDTPEVEKVVNFIGDQRGYPDSYLLPEYIDEKDPDWKDFNIQDRDPKFPEAARIIVQTQQGSTSLLQRRLKLGYNRAGRLMDQLESAGIVGPGLGSKPREVFVKTDSELEAYLQNLT